jgi:hypothetical protein
MDRTSTRLGEPRYKDSVLATALVPLQYPIGDGVRRPSSSRSTPRNFTTRSPPTSRPSRPP